MSKDFIELSAGDLFATVEIVETENGYSTEWWVSSNFDYELRLLANINVPIWGMKLEDVRNRVRFLRDDIFSFILKAYSPPGFIHFVPSADVKSEIAERHLRYFYGTLSFYDDKERFAAGLFLLEQFKVKDIAVILAKLLDMNVRTVHDWIYKSKV